MFNFVTCLLQNDVNFKHTSLLMSIIGTFSCLFSYIMFNMLHNTSLLSEELEMEEDEIEDRTS